MRNVVTKDTGDVVVEGKSSVSSTESETSSERARVSIPWTLSREPIGEGPGGPENLSWNPTNQTIKDWRSIYRNTSLSNQTQKKRRARWIPKACVVDGEIPSDLQGGTLLRNGPGMLDIYGKEINQFFDGDGLVHSSPSLPGRLKSEKDATKIRFKHNFVETKGFCDEREAQQMLYKGAFAVGNPKGDSFYNPFDFDVKNVANMGVVEWNDKVCSVVGRRKPHELRKNDLNTIGKEVDEVLGQELRVPQMAAHYRVEENKETKERTLITFSIESHRVRFHLRQTKPRFTNGTKTERKRNGRILTCRTRCLGFPRHFSHRELVLFVPKPDEFRFSKVDDRMCSPSVALGRNYRHARR